LPAVTSPLFQQYVAGLGILAPLIVIVYTVISHVFAPVSGSPGVLLGFALYGVINGTILLYIASLISATINFYIARKLGRKWTERLAGKKSMEDIDKFVETSGTKVLIISRVFGFPIYEVISYAAGLTKMSFNRYLTITAVFGAIPSVIFVLFFKDTDFTKPANMIMWLGILIIVGVIFTYFLRKHMLSRTKSKKEKV
jgi:uncharacterized membrane protein YdjX (TVP38/TMEM64 family)